MLFFIEQFKMLNSSLNIFLYFYRSIAYLNLFYFLFDLYFINKVCYVILHYHIGLMLMIKYFLIV